jgi:hypothetical protein
MGQSLLPFESTYENVGIVGGALDHPWRDLGRFLHLDGELGLASRFGSGQPTSMEGWAALRLRTSAITIGPVMITPAFAFGFSAVTDTIGIETRRGADNHGSATFLGYLRPEVAISLVSRPDLQIVYGLQHRSGAWHTLGNLGEGANADIVGIRRTF